MPSAPHSHSHGGKECHGHGSTNQKEEEEAEEEAKPHSHSHGDGHACSHSHSHSGGAPSSPATPASYSLSLEEHPAPTSLWNQLLGNDEDDDDDQDDAAEYVSPTLKEEEPPQVDFTAIQLLGQHLAKVKLEAEERAHAFRQHIAKLERDKREQSQVLGESQDLVLQLEAKVKELEMQMTKKWQIEYRDNWIAQVESLKLDKKKLKEENEQMKASIQHLTSSLQARAEHDDDRDDDDEDDEQEHADDDQLFAKTLADLTQSKETNDRLAAEVEELKQQLAQSERTCLAFKSKLDKELELKWELAKRNHWEEEEEKHGGILDAIVQVVAPRPSE